MAVEVTGTATEQAAAGTSVTTTIPSDASGGLRSGEDLICIMSSVANGAADTPTTPTGFAELVSTFLCGGSPASNPATTVYYKVSDGTEGGSTVAVGGDTSGNRFVLCWLIRGADVENILSDTPSIVQGASGTTRDPGAQDIPTDGGSFVLVVDDAVFDNGQTYTPASGYVELAHQELNSNPALQQGVYFDEVPSGGTIDPGAFTSSNDDEYAIVHIGINPASAGTSADPGIAAATDTALAPDATKSVSVGIAIESNTALALSVASGINVDPGVSTETCTALALSATKIAVAGVGAESDSALSVTAEKQTAPGVAVESGAALAPGVAKLTTPGAAVEADAALSTVATKTASVDVAGETDTALPLAVVKIADVGRANESDVAFSLLDPAQRLDVGVATEFNAALASTIVERAAVGLAVENCEAQSPTIARGLPTGLAEETATALVLVAAKRADTGDSGETDAALSLFVGKLIAAGLASETNEALSPYDPTQYAGVGVAVEVDAATASSFFKSAAVGLTTEVNTALTAFGGYSISEGHPRLVAALAESRSSAAAAEHRNSTA